MTCSCAPRGLAPIAAVIFTSTGVATQALYSPADAAPTVRVNVVKLNAPQTCFLCLPLSEGELWDVTYTDPAIPFSENELLLQSQPWYSDPDRAGDFAVAVGLQLGLPNQNLGVISGDGLGIGPFFAYLGLPLSGPNPVLGFGGAACQPGPLFNSCFRSNQRASDIIEQPIFYATATRVQQSSASPVPGPLPILGALATYGTSRKLRRRLACGNVDTAHKVANDRSNSAG